jgi:DNA-binding GntR family transcriptional regulator
MQFHLRIAELARCPGLKRAIEKEQVLVFNWLYDVTAKRRTNPEEFHTTLADALCTGDPLVADAAMRAHVQYGIDQVLERLANHQNGDVWRLKTKSSDENAARH